MLAVELRGLKMPDHCNVPFAWFARNLWNAQIELSNQFQDERLIPDTFALHQRLILKTAVIVE